MMLSSGNSDFDAEKKELIKQQGEDAGAKRDAYDFMLNTAKYKYTYNFLSLGRPIIQFPQDMIAMQELIWEVKPDLIIETGIAHGGSLVASASMLALLDLVDATVNQQVLDPTKPKRRVLGIDIDIREHNRRAIESHPLSNRIDMIEGSSVVQETIQAVYDFARDYNNILVCLDSNHTHEHVLKELEAYAHLTSVNSYCVVFDTIIEDMPDDSFPDRPWGQGDNPKTAVWEYLKAHGEGDGEGVQFAIDHELENKLMITVAPDGYLKRIK